MRCVSPAVCLGIFILFTFGVFAGDALGQTTLPADPWPGYVPGGRYFRSAEWGVSFWGPGGTDQQFETTNPGVLVRYSMGAMKGKPGWVITVLANKVRSELPGDELLNQSADQLRRGLGKRLSDLAITSASADKAGGSPLAVGRITCTVAPDRGGAGSQTIRREYFYLRLRAKQYMTILAETAPETGDNLAQIVSSLAKSVSVWDPQQDTARIIEAAKPAAQPLAKMPATEWTELAGKSQPRWSRVYSTPPSAGSKAEHVGWAYVSTASKGSGLIESITAVRVGKGDGAVALYRQATIKLDDGAETVREWNRLTGKTAGSASEVYIVSRRAGVAVADGAAEAGPGSDTFEVTSHSPGHPDRTYKAKIPGIPYLPVALQELVCQKLVGQPGQPGKLFVAFTFSMGQVVLATIQPIGPEQVDVGGRKVEAFKWQVRPSAGEPEIVRLTDPTGAKVLRIQSLPDAWTELADEADVPADVRRELTTAPQWP